MGSGKSFALCAEGIALSCDYPGNRGYICRDTLKAFKKTTYLVLDDMLQRSGLITKHHQTDNYYILQNGSAIYYGGLGDDQKAIERLKSMELGWFAIDEASETTERFFLMLASRLRIKLPDIRYFGLLASNPDPGWLKHRFIDRKEPDHVFIPALPRDNGKLAPGYIERLEAIFPDAWRKQFLEGDWTAFEGINNVFPFQAISKAMQNEIEPGKPRELGIDVARYGDDEFVIVLREGGKVSIRRRIKKSDLMEATGIVVQEIKDLNPDGVKVDADGLGSGVVDRLGEVMPCEWLLKVGITEIHAGVRANDSERFRNRKAEIYWGFRERLIAGEVSLPDDLDLQAQLTSITYKVNSTGQIEIISKEEMKRNGLKSPDIAEAVIYAFTEPDQPVRTGQIWFPGKERIVERIKRKEEKESQSSESIPVLVPRETVIEEPKDKKDAGRGKGKTRVFI